MNADITRRTEERGLPGNIFAPAKHCLAVTIEFESAKILKCLEGFHAAQCNVRQSGHIGNSKLKHCPTPAQGFLRDVADISYAVPEQEASTGVQYLTGSIAVALFIYNHGIFFKEPHQVFVCLKFRSVTIRRPVICVPMKVSWPETILAAIAVLKKSSRRKILQYDQ